MDDKKYQVFVSSTYSDLAEERRVVMQALLEMNCIPAGMEWFPAIDEEQFQFIRRIIDDSDYYLIIVGGRYGSISPSGVSYTEAEYDYAVERGMKVISLVHQDPSELSVANSETDPEKISKLERLRSKLMTGRLVRKWSRAEDLPGLVMASLVKTFALHPNAGWVRGDSVASRAQLLELNSLQVENSRLQTENSKLRLEIEQKQTLSSGQLLEAKAEELNEFLSKEFVTVSTADATKSKILPPPTMTAGAILLKLTLPLFDPVSREQIESDLMKMAGGKYPVYRRVPLPNEPVELLAFHFSRMGIIEVTVERETNTVFDRVQTVTRVYWRLTDIGRELLMKLRSTNDDATNALDG